MSIIDHCARTVRTAAGNSRFDATLVHDRPGQAGRPLVISDRHRPEVLDALPVRTHVNVGGRVLRKVSPDLYRADFGPDAGAGCSNREVLNAAATGALPGRATPPRFVPAPRSSPVATATTVQAPGGVEPDHEPQGVAAPRWADTVCPGSWTAARGPGSSRPGLVTSTASTSRSPACKR